MSEELNKYKKELEKELKKIEEVRNEFYQKTRGGESLTREENKKNSKLTGRAKEIKEQLDTIESIFSLETLKDEISRLGKRNVSESEKNDAIIPFVVYGFEEHNKKIAEDFSKETGISKEDLEKADEIKNKLEQDIRSLTYELESAKKRNFNVNDIEKEIKEKEKVLDSYEEFLKKCIDIKQLKADLKAIAEDKSISEDEIVEIKANIVKLEEHNQFLLSGMEFLKSMNLPTTDTENEILKNEETIEEYKKIINEKTTTTQKKLTDEEIKSLENEKEAAEQAITYLENGLEFAKSRNIETKDIETELVEKKKELKDIEDKLDQGKNIISKEDVEVAKTALTSLENEIKYLENGLEFAKIRNLETKDIETEIDKKKTLLKQYSEVINKYDNQQNANLISDKKKLLDKYNLIIDELIVSKNKELESKMKNSSGKKGSSHNNPDDDKDKTFKEKLEEFKNNIKTKVDDTKAKAKAKTEDLKAKTKAKLNKTDEELEQSVKTGLKITGVVLLAVVIFVICRGCAKNNNNNNNNELTSGEPTTSHSDGVLDPNSIVNLPEEYQNPVYIQDIKNAYNLTDEEVNDLINRAYKIYESGFYNEGTALNEIIGVLDAINNQEINRTENANEDQSINASLTDVYNHYAFGTVTETDLNKIATLPYFAKEGTELRKALTTYSELMGNLIACKGDEEKTKAAKAELFKFLEVFANSRAGYIPADTELLAENISKYSSAIMTDTFSWGIFYETFVKPLLSAGIDMEELPKWIQLQININSAYEQWVELYYCEGTELTLGK